MNLNKVRSIILASLLLLNIFFAIILYNSSREISLISAEMKNNALKVLSSSGISLKEEIIPDIRPKQFIYSYNTPVNEFLIDEKGKLFENLKDYFLSSFDVSEKIDITSFEIPDGLSYQINIIKSDDSSLTHADLIFSGDFGFSYKISSKEFSIFNEIENGNALLPRKIKKNIDRFFNLAKNFGKGYDYQISSVIETEDRYGVFCIQLIDKIPIEDMELYFEFTKNNELIGINGQWCFSDFERKYSEDLIDGINILFSMLDLDPVEILNIDLIYLPLKYNTDNYYIIPAWSVIFTDKDKNIVNTIYEAIKGTELIKKHINQTNV